ncbi:MAG: hypothetical protein K2H75_01555 [Muribaculaceae bacterium]|nr:hypothetical protein [Muribaculaceae bacterium]
MAYEIMRHDVAPERALMMLDSLFSHHSKELSDVQEAMLLRRQIELSMAIGRYHTASAALERLRKYKGEFTFADAMKMELDAGVCSYYSGEYAEAIKSAFTVLSERKPDSLSQLDIRAYLLLSNISTRIGAPEESKKFLDIAQKATDRITSDSLRRECEYRIYLGRSGYSMVTEDYKNAYNYLQKSDSLGVHGVAPYCLETNFAVIYYLEGADDMAESYYRRVLEADGIHYNKCVALNNYTDFLIDHGRTDEALAIMDINLPQLITVNATHLIGIRQLMRFKALASKGDLEHSVLSADSALNIMVTLMAQESRRMYSQVYSKFEADRIADNYNNVTHLNKTLCVFGSILLVLFIMCAVRLWFSKIKQRSLTIDIETGRSNLADCHRDYGARISTIQEELDRKNRDLAKLELKNTHLVTRLDSLTAEPYMKENDSTKIVADIKTELRKLSRNSSDWSAFEIYFGQVQTDFYEQLARLHPDLTAGERRMCAFVKAGMKTPEIATMCHRSPRTVESMKYRLKKKLGLSAEVSLDRYLATLDSEQIQ